MLACFRFGLEPVFDGRAILFTVHRLGCRFTIFFCSLLLIAILIQSRFLPALANDQSVDLELVLAVDVSRSINDEEYALQMAGYANAFRDQKVTDAILSQPRGVLVTMIQWGDRGQQKMSIPWRLLKSKNDILDFAKRIEESSRARLGHGTGLAQALQFAARLFDRNGFNGTRQVIDVSGDGRDNVGPFPMIVREGLISMGITINGLAILNEDSTLQYYYESVVAGGEQSFVESAEDYVDFALAIKRKLVREISNTTLSENKGNTTLQSAFLR